MAVMEGGRGNCASFYPRLSSAGVDFVECDRTRIFHVRQNKINRQLLIPINFIRQSIILQEPINRYCILIGILPVNMLFYLLIGQLLCNFEFQIHALKHNFS